MTDGVSKKSTELKTKYLKPVVFILLFALITEILVFNFRSIQSVFYKETVLPVDGYLMTGMKYFGDGVYKMVDEDVTGYAVVDEGREQAELDYDTGNGVDGNGNAVRALYITGLDERAGRIHSIKIDTDNSAAIDLPMSESGVLYVKTHIRDEGNELYETIDWHPVIESNEASKYIYMQPAGDVSAIALEFDLSNGRVFGIKSLTLNPHRPLVFSFYRFMLMIFIFTAAYALRPSSVLWKIEAIKKEGWKSLVMLGLCFIYIMPAWLLVQDNVYLTNFSEFNPYQDLAQALTEGHFYLNEVPDPALAELSNPYDDGLRSAMGIDTKWDYAYYDGKYYVYFGIIPCLIFYLPFWALLGMNMPNALVVFTSAVFLLVGIYELIKAMAAVFYPKLRYAVLLILTTMIYFGCQIPFFLNQPDGYAVPVACAEAMLVWAFYFWISSLTADGWKMYVRIAAGSFIMALVAGTRPNMEIYALLAIPLFAGKVKDCMEKKTAVKFAAAFIVPFIPVAAGLMYYNAARFGSVFDFGNNYNLTVNDVSLNPFSFDKLLIGIYEYLLKLPQLAYTFPFMSIPGDGTETNAFGHCFVHMEYIFSGLLSVNLILFTLPALFCRKTEGKDHLRFFGITALVTSLFLLVFDSESAGIVYRYEADFSIVLFMAAVAALMIIMQKAEKYEGAGGEVIRRAITFFLLVALAWSLIYHFNFYFLTGLKYPLIWGNTEMYYRVFYAFNFL